MRYINDLQTKIKFLAYEWRGIEHTFVEDLEIPEHVEVADISPSMLCSGSNSR
jgi:hypothetical protein